MGGLNENGKNTYIVEVDDKIFVFDAGLKYANDTMYGIDYIIPDYDYLEKNKKFGLNTPVFEQLIIELKYVIGYIVAISLYKKYKLDNNYMNEIQNLHKLINELDVNDFIDRMNISTGVEDICEILKEYISLFVGCENKKIK